MSLISKYRATGHAFNPARVDFGITDHIKTVAAYDG